MFNLQRLTGSASVGRGDAGPPSAASLMAFGSAAACADDELGLRAMAAQLQAIRPGRACHHVFNPHRS